MANYTRINKRKYHFIYKTTCLTTGRYYIGMHSTDNLNDSYLGSGKRLKYSINKYGKENHVREILEHFDTREALAKREEEIVNLNEIKDPRCMNLMTGGHGGGLGTVSVKDKDGNTMSVFTDDLRYLSGELVGVSKGKVPVKDKNGNMMQVSVDDPRYLSGELKWMLSGTVIIKDKDDNRFTVSIDDPRYISGEFVGVTKGTLPVKDKDGNTMRVSVNDPRYLSGELTSIWKGKKHRYETIEKMKHSLKDKRSGKRNSQYGTCWITNGKENRKIKKDEEIPEGFKPGRKTK